jgi:hypothetical protein
MAAAMRHAGNKNVNVNTVSSNETMPMALGGLTCAARVSCAKRTRRRGFVPSDGV